MRTQWLALSLARGGFEQMGAAWYPLILAIARLALLNAYTEEELPG